MKFEIDKCPKCGGDIHGTEDTLYATAELIRDDETGEYEYEGRTEIWWDSQTTDAGPSGHPLVRCSDCEHIWETPCDEYPPAVADESEATAPDLLEALKAAARPMVEYLRKYGMDKEASRLSVEIVNLDISLAEQEAARVIMEGKQ